MNEIADKLKEIIDREGPDVVINEPYEVYLELLKTHKADRKTAASLLHTFLMEIPKCMTGSKKHSLEDISKIIQKECFFKKVAADRMAEIYLSLYSKENGDVWREKRLSGLRSFMEQEWEIEWDGEVQWDAGQVYMDCDYHATIVIAPTEEMNDPMLDQMLKKNPFLDCEQIAGYFRDMLLACLDSEFEDYCTCDDYYPPVVEDFDAEYYVKNWCSEHGFELVSFDGAGDTGDYKPKSKRRY